MEEERLIELVKHIKNNVVVGSCVEVRAWELSIYKNDLLRNSKGGKGTISNLPFKE